MAGKVLTRAVCFVVCAGLLNVLLTDVAVAQTEEPATMPPPEAQAEASATGPDRSGFTFELTLGFGLQVLSGDEGDSETDPGVSILNLGIGGFFNPSFALLFRTMGTVTFQEVVPGLDLTTISGVGGPAVQYWPIDVLRIEAGIGVAFASFELSSESGGIEYTATEDEGGFGLLFGTAWAFWQNPKHSLSLGFEYAPGFFDGFQIHNMGFVFGWQLL